MTFYWSVTISRIHNENILAHFKLKLKKFRGRETNSVKRHDYRLDTYSGYEIKEFVSHA